MSGPMIAFTSMMTMFALAALLIFSTEIFKWIAKTWSNGGWFVRTVLLIPLALAAVLYVVAWPLAILLGLFGAYSLAVGIRDWSKK